MNFVWKAHDGEVESIVLLTSVLWRWFNRQWMRSGVGWGGGGGLKLHPFLRGILAKGISITHSSMLHSLDVFYVLFLWVIAVSDFHTSEIYKNLGLLLSTITFRINSHVDNYFYIHIYLFQILYSIFLSKYTLRLFIFKFD